MLIKEKIRINQVIEGTWKSLIISFFDCSFAYLVNEFVLANYFTFPVFVPTILGTVLAFFIGFNNNQAYDRWWEARKIWGSLVNNSRSFAREILTFVNPKDSPEITQLKHKIIKRHIAFLYSLKIKLRETEDDNLYKYISPEELEELAQHSNQYNGILLLQSEDITHLYNNGHIDGFQLIELNKMLTSFSDDMGKSERIKKTIFPTIYNFYSNYFILIFIYCVTMTIGNSIGFWAIIFGTLIGYIFYTIQAIGKMLVNPFDNNNHMGVSLDSITRTIEINLLEMISAPNVPKPIEPVNGEYIM